MFETRDVELLSGAMLTGLVEQVRSDLAPLLDLQVLESPSDDQVVGALQMAEAPGRIGDAARIVLAHRVGTRAQGPWQDSLCARAGCATGRDVIAAAGASGREASARVRAAEDLCPGPSLTGEPLPARLPRLGAAMDPGAHREDAEVRVRTRPSR